MQAAIRLPFPSVESAANELAPARRIDEARAAMKTGIVKGTEFILAAAYDEVGHVVANGVRHAVADLGNIFRAAGVLPDLAPQSLALQFGEGRIVVATERYRIGRRHIVTMHFQSGGQFLAVHFQQFRGKRTYLSRHSLFHVALLVFVRCSCLTHLNLILRLLHGSTSNPAPTPVFNIIMAIRHSMLANADVNKTGMPNMSGRTSSRTAIKAFGRGMVRPAGIEPATLGFGGQYSIH